MLLPQENSYIGAVEQVSDAILPRPNGDAVAAVQATSSVASARGCPVLHVTSLADCHKPQCQLACEMLREAGFVSSLRYGQVAALCILTWKVRMLVGENLPHGYYPELLEPLAWDFLSGWRLK
jgi:hypothetical protein